MISGYVQVALNSFIPMNTILLRKELRVPVYIEHIEEIDEGIIIDPKYAYIRSIQFEISKNCSL